MAQQLMAGQDLDLDSMSYEQLLALGHSLLAHYSRISSCLIGEAVGDVKVGIQEDELPEVCDVKRLRTMDITQLQSTTPEAVDYDGRCAVCLEPYSKGDEAATLIGCTHQFHYECLSRWLQVCIVVSACVLSTTVVSFDESESSYV